MKKNEIKKLDALWREAVKLKYGEYCMICGKTQNLNIHHIITRNNRATRWYIPNGVVLCSCHHTLCIDSAHKNPLWFSDKIKDKRGLNWWNDLQKQSNLIHKKSYEETKQILQREIQKLRRLSE